MEIKYINGDATNLPDEGVKVIVHCCNNEGKWGSGFVVALSKKWKQPEHSYRTWVNLNNCWFNVKTLPLGEVQFVKVERDIYVANLIGQNGIKTKENPAPINYKAIEIGLGKVREFCIEKDASIHAPKFGSGLAGGDWKIIEQIIKDVCKNISVTIYFL